MSLFVSKHLRLIHAGYENYSGPIGAYEFVDGVSVEAIPLIARDRLSVAFDMVEVEEDGIETPAGPAFRLNSNKDLQIEPPAPALRQSEDEKTAEELAFLLGSQKILVLRSRANLEHVADEMGIAGVRLAAEPWNARSKSIPSLIDLILGAQTQYVAARINDLVQKGALQADAEALFLFKDDAALPMQPREEEEKKLAEQAGVPAVIETPVVPAPEAPVNNASATVEAATSGDLGAALSQE